MYQISIIVILLTTCCFIASTKAQNSATSIILNQLNTQIQGIDQGVFDVVVHFKAATLEDTVSQLGRVYFFKNREDPHAFARFALFYQDTLACVYDGKFFYNFNDLEKTVYVTSTELYPPQKLILGNIFQSGCLFLPYLKTRTPAFDPEQFNAYSVDTIQTPESSSIQLSYLELYLNDLKLAPNDPDTGEYKVVYTISLPEFSLQSITEWDRFMASPQFHKIDFSPIRPLPPTTILNMVVPWAELFDSGYLVSYYDPEAERPADPDAVLADFLPAFALPDLDGNIIYSDSLQKGILLLDFWYRSCYPCLKAMPTLEKLHLVYQKKGLTVLGINPIDQDAGNLKDFLAKRNLSYPSLLDQKRELPGLLNISIYPTLLLVDASSKKILHTEIGFGENSEAALIELIEAALKN